ncbi:MAG: DNA mismatch endonuclease Vsr [Croceibacterium sp.]
MAAIKGGNTQPELLIRRFLHAAGLRYRLHVKLMPGKPDLVLSRHRAVIFVHGCFWHQHDCHLFKWPRTRPDFWREKIGRNVENDDKAVTQLLADGWRVATVWECALKGRSKLDFTQAMERLIGWIQSDERMIRIRGG